MSLIEFNPDFKLLIEQFKRVADALDRAFPFPKEGERVGRFTAQDYSQSEEMSIYETELRRMMQEKIDRDNIHSQDDRSLSQMLAHSNITKNE